MGVEFMPDLPQNANGKVLRKVLKEPFWQGRERRVKDKEEVISWKKKEIFRKRSLSFIAFFVLPAPQ
jgi:hypothetical protein